MTRSEGGGGGVLALKLAEWSLFFCPPFLQPNRDLDMFINASKNFNLNITWATSFTGTWGGEEGVEPQYTPAANVFTMTVLCPFSFILSILK